MPPDFDFIRFFPPTVSEPPAPDLVAGDYTMGAHAEPAPVKMEGDATRTFNR